MQMLSVGWVRFGSEICVLVVEERVNNKLGSCCRALHQEF